MPKKNNNLISANLWSNNAKNMAFPTLDEMPDIGLYMDQVLVLLEKYIGVLFPSEKIEDKDSFITPSMINNYVKHGIMPSPQSKKYTKEHIAYLIIICLMKQALSISNIKCIIEKELLHTDIAKLYSKFVEYYHEYLKCIIENTSISLENQALEDYNLKLGIIANVCRLINDNTLPKIKKQSKTDSKGKSRK